MAPAFEGRDSWVGQGRVFAQLATTLGAQRRHILELYNHRFSTGPVKGTINKIRTMQRQANGFRDREFLISKRTPVFVGASTLRWNGPSLLTVNSHMVGLPR